uniref:Uncharacterized protein n=1 Tax=Arundo donax TaxID=35708 RepID=A0A0A8YJD9_ARUDO
MEQQLIRAPNNICVYYPAKTYKHNICRKIAMCVTEASIQKRSIS